MAVLIEALSVVAKRSSIDNKYVGGWEAFVAAVPNNTLCYDDQLARVGFMVGKDAEEYVRHLELNGLTHLDQGKPVDIAGVSQVSGLVMECDWLEFGHMELDDPGERVAYCFASGSNTAGIAVPLDWQFEGSMSQRYVFADGNSIKEGFKFLRHEDGVDVYLNLLSGEEVFVGRTTK